jgi:hypothetical protein
MSCFAKSTSSSKLSPAVLRNIASVYNQALSKSKAEDNFKSEVNMKNRAPGSRIPLVLTFFLLWQGGVAAQADVISGVFSNPVLLGSLLNDPNVGDLLSQNDSATAADSTSNHGSTLSWGSSATLPPAQAFSQLTFVGNAPSATPHAPFQVGTINYLNGSSDNGTGIFGATLSFYLDGDLLGSDNVIISTTENHFTGTGLTPAQLAEDADYINICGNNSSICGNSLEAFEDSEGGVGVTANLMGTLVGDPTLNLTAITVSANQAGNGGVVGNLPALGETVPEPSSVRLAIAALFFLGIGLTRRYALNVPSPHAAANIRRG